MSFADEILRFRDEIVPPRFNKIAVRDASVFDAVPRAEPKPTWRGGPPLEALFGIPVLVDESVDPGVIELRLGDELIERVVLGA